jgi:hypothetical protein
MIIHQSVVKMQREFPSAAEEKGEKKVIQNGNSVTVLYLYNREEVLIL